MTFQTALAEGIRILSIPSPSAFIDTPALDAALLLSEILHIRREELITRGNENMIEKDHEKFMNLVERRKSGECVAYILGRKEFRGLEFIVNSHVLVPRPETETLLETALEYIEAMTRDSVKQEDDKKNLSVLDLCTGSGALAISLKKERPCVAVTASDICADALETAAFNAARLLGSCTSAGRTFRFIQSDLFENILGKFNIILSNPPYVPTEQLSALAPEVRLEPRLALDGGAGGLSLIKKIILKAQEHLLPGGVILLEAAPGQVPEIKILLENHHFRGIRIRKDLAGWERVISGISG